MTCSGSSALGPCSHPLVIPSPTATAASVPWRQQLPRYAARGSSGARRRRPDAEQSGQRPDRAGRGRTERAEAGQSGQRQDNLWRRPPRSIQQAETGGRPMSPSALHGLTSGPSLTDHRPARSTRFLPSCYPPPLLRSISASVLSSSHLGVRITSPRPASTALGAVLAFRRHFIGILRPLFSRLLALLGPGGWAGGGVSLG